MSRETLVRAWSAGAGPGCGPLTIDLDSTICETYGLAKEGAQRHNYAGQRGYHPLLAIAAGTGDVLMARLRQGRSNTARGAAHFLVETVSRVRYAGATGQLTVRADSGFYTHAIVAACRKAKVRFSITVRQHQSLRNIIEAMSEEEWAPIPYWMEGTADVAETTYTPFQSAPDAVPVRLIVRRVKPTPGAWLAVQVMPHNLTRWTTRIGLGEQMVTTKTLRQRFFSLAGRLTRKARRLTLHLPRGWPWQNQFGRAVARLRALPLPS